MGAEKKMVCRVLITVRDLVWNGDERMYKCIYSLPLAGGGEGGGQSSRDRRRGETRVFAVQKNVSLSVTVARLGCRCAALRTWRSPSG